LRSGLNGATQNNNNALLVLVDSGALELRNGTISGNTNANSNGNGGGVYMTGTYSSFTMSGGTISGNTASNSTEVGAAPAYGGGVYVYFGTFTMSGGTISGNTVYSYSPSSSSVMSSGGGVRVGGSGTFIMSGGTISGNVSSGGSLISSGSGGGGVSVGGTFRIVTGTIYGSGEGDLSNTVDFPVNVAGAALRGTAERGYYSGSTWNSLGDLSTTEDTIRVVDGVQQ